MTPRARRADEAERRRAPQTSEPLTQQKLEALALAYLNRFDCTAHKLTQHLRGRASKLGGHESAAAWIAEIVARYRASGLLDDGRFARNLAAQLAARGKSTRAIAQRLLARGVAAELVSELLDRRQREEPAAELEAARAFVRRRRLGPYRSEDQREARRHKDLASLARQGFSFDIARRALGPGESTEDEF